MRSIKAVHATAETIARFGAVQKLTESDCFRGDGWECWMTEDACLSHPAHVTTIEAKTCLPCEVASMMRRMESETLLFSAGTRPLVVALADSDPESCPRAEDIAAFILEPGELLLVRRGIWQDIPRGLNGGAWAFCLSYEKEEPDEFRGIEGGPAAMEA